MRKSILLLLTVAACTTTAQDFDRGAVSERQFMMDSAACEMEGEKGRKTNALGGMAGIASYYESYNAVYDACMRSKGYSRAD